MASWQHKQVESRSNLALKGNEYANQFDHDTKLLRVHAKTVKEAVDVLKKEQKRIERKRQKPRSKELPTCIENYNKSLMELKAALKQMVGEVVTDTESEFADQRFKCTHSLYDRKEETSVCSQCLKKDDEIKQLKENLKRSDRKEKENEEHTEQQQHPQQLHISNRKQVEVTRPAETRKRSQDVSTCLKQFRQVNEELNQPERQRYERYEYLYREETAAKCEALRRSETWNAPRKGKKRECVKCYDKDTKIRKLEDDLKSFNQVNHAYEELQHQNQAERKQREQYERMYKEEKDARDDALRRKKLQDEIAEKSKNSIAAAEAEVTKLKTKLVEMKEECKGKEDIFRKRFNEVNHAYEELQQKNQAERNHRECYERMYKEEKDAKDDALRRKKLQDEIAEKSKNSIAAAEAEVTKLKTELVEMKEECKRKEDILRKRSDIKEKENQNNVGQMYLKKVELQQRYQYERQARERYYERRRRTEEAAKNNALRSRGFKQMNRVNADLQQRYKSVRQERERYERMFQIEKAAKDDALRSRGKLHNINPNITDLSDQNRPTKIAEKILELYDNQWTDAYDALERQGMEERLIIRTLLDTLMAVYRECNRLACEDFFERVQRSIEVPFPVEDVNKRIRTENQGLKEIQVYISCCIEICWLCAVQDPPLVLKAQTTDRFDTNTFKGYTKHGKHIDFVVWPAMYLHDGGVLLSKGIAQGSDHARAIFDET